MDAARRRELQELLARLADGDRAAFPPAFTLLWPVTRAFARSFLRDEGGAEDAAQQALVRVFLRAAEFDASRPALPWVLGVVANECRTLRRRAQRRREGPLEEADARPDPGATPEESATGRDLERAALAALDGLPAPDVEAILAGPTSRAVSRPRGGAPLPSFRSSPGPGAGAGIPPWPRSAARRSSRSPWPFPGGGRSGAAPSCPASPPAWLRSPCPG
jgi:DNA-directed RNA polymerase specialized sigma24 family protein